MTIACRGGRRREEKRRKEKRKKKQEEEEEMMCCIVVGLGLTREEEMQEANREEIERWHLDSRRD